MGARGKLALLVLLALAWGAGSRLDAGEARDPGRSGPYAVGYRLISVSQGGIPFTAWLFYPATDDGYGRALDAAGAPYPAIAFGHAFLTPPLFYTANARHLASWGFAVVLPRTAVQLVPYVPGFATDLVEALGELIERGSDPGSFLYRAIDADALGIAGHSMGGGASILAAADDPRIRALVAFSPSETFWPISAVERIAEVEGAVVLLAGTADTITPPAAHQRPLYAAAGPPRILVTLDGGGHCEYTPALPACGGVIPRERQFEIARRWLVATMGLYLHDDSRYADWIWGPLAETPDVELERDAGFELVRRGRPEVEQASDTRTTRGRLQADPADGLPRGATGRCAANDQSQNQSPTRLQSVSSSASGSSMSQSSPSRMSRESPAQSSSSRSPVHSGSPSSLSSKGSASTNPTPGR
jgi:dienelactone hydrolase